MFLQKSLLIVEKKSIFQKYVVYVDALKASPEGLATRRPPLSCIIVSRHNLPGASNPLISPPFHATHDIRNVYQLSSPHQDGEEMMGIACSALTLNPPL